MPLLKKLVHLLKISIFGLMKMMNSPMLAFEYDLEVRKGVWIGSKELYTKADSQLKNVKKSVEEYEKEITSIEKLLSSKKLDLSQAKIEAHKLLCLKNQVKLLSTSIETTSATLTQDFQNIQELMFDIKSRSVRLETYKQRRALSSCRGKSQELKKLLVYNNTEKVLEDSLRLEEYKLESSDKLEKDLGTKTNLVEQHEILDLLSTYDYNESDS